MAASATLGTSTCGRVCFPKRQFSSSLKPNSATVSELGFVASHLSGLKIPNDLSFQPLKQPISTNFAPFLQPVAPCKYCFSNVIHDTNAETFRKHKSFNFNVQMRRVCPFTGKKANKANKISHSAHKTKKLQFVNLQYKKIWWEAGKRYVKLRLSTKALKTIEKNGLDAVAKKAGIDLRKE
ncbi:50S ribosomal protein L28 [Morus notabilis]|uniref:Large ribosomal subunit protein bL28c n=1 Tax=Morus notabilis TaxID=981085 RepID=W9QPT4_9ROSA|nr:50S ribosomal protein L28 [Morus notabilis]